MSIYTLSNVTGAFFGVSDGKTSNLYHRREANMFVSGDLLSVVKERNTIRFIRNNVDLGIYWSNVIEGPLIPFVANLGGSPSISLVSYNL